MRVWMCATCTLVAGGAAVLAACAPRTTLVANWYLVADSTACATVDGTSRRPCLYASLRNTGPDDLTITIEAFRGVGRGVPSARIDLTAGELLTIELGKFDCRIPSDVVVVDAKGRRSRVPFPVQGTAFDEVILQQCRGIDDAGGSSGKE